MARARLLLHATDFSPASRRAFLEALRLAKQDRARLCVLHVMTPPSPFVGDRLPPSYLELMAGARRDAERQLATRVDHARKAGARAEGMLTEGRPSDVILRTARRQRPDMIVIGTHGRTGLGRMLMGSVAEEVLRQARLPVLTVR